MKRPRGPNGSAWLGLRSAIVAPNVNRMDLMKAEQLEGNPANWSLGILYRCKADPRWIVPMRYTNSAWTPNIAHPLAILLALVILGAAIAPLVIAISSGAMHDPRVAFIAILCLFAFIIPPGVIARYRSS